MSFWQRNLAAAKLAWIQQFEYRLNLFVDAMLQPVLTAAMEVCLWYAMIGSMGQGASLGGFPRENYLHYALWAAFFARVSSNWMYEFRMAEDIQSGTVNVILTRPLYFYEFYLAQFLSYKGLTAILSFMIPAVLVYFFFPGPTDLSKLPVACALVLWFLVLIYNFSFIVVCGGFHFNKINSFTVAKNLAIWCLTGELFPIDLAPTAWKNVLMSLPFVSGVYVPVGYMTGRCDWATVVSGFKVTGLWIVGTGIVGAYVWRRSIKSYAGTGA